MFPVTNGPPEAKPNVHINPVFKRTSNAGTNSVCTSKHKTTDEYLHWLNKVKQLYDDHKQATNTNNPHSGTKATLKDEPKNSPTTNHNKPSKKNSVSGLVITPGSQYKAIPNPGHQHSEPRTSKSSEKVDKLKTERFCQTMLTSPHAMPPKSGFIRNHFRPSVPFSNVLSKGWFVNPTCSVDCLNNVPIDLQSCCFISKKYIPSNTLNVNELLRKANNAMGTVNNPPPKKSEDPPLSNVKESPTLVSISKHKLVRKQKPITAAFNDNSSLVFYSSRKLIRKNKPNTKVHIDIPLVNNYVSKIKENYRLKINPIPVPSVLNKKKQRSSSTLILTKRKLVRRNSVISVENKSKPVAGVSKPEPVTVPVVTVNQSNVFSQIPEKLITINRNKLIRSTLLRKTNRVCAPSVLCDMIKQRRRPCAGTSYVLLTRNKLIKQGKADKEYKKLVLASAEVPKPLSKKMFISLGNNRLIRKSLFKKNNKPEPSMKSKTLMKTLKSPSRSAQRKTNHIARRNMKYFRGRSTLVKNRYTNKHKNNKKILRTKKTSICPVFRREGLCKKQAKNECPYVHDKKYIVLCKNFLKNNCENEDCPLSHDLSVNKVPVCHRFINESCSVENCIYLHMKPATDAPVCVQFLRGYCKAGKECPNWHVYACPEYKNSSVCKKGEKCSLPHRSLDYFRGLEQVDSDEEDRNWRYFEKNKLDGKRDTGISIIPERHMLGDLPDYIPI